jgi:excisionase family DNA binding protein
LFCRHYSTCLDQAARLGWSGFSCSQCQAYAPPALEIEEVMGIGEACERLLSCVFSQVSPGQVDFTEGTMTIKEAARYLKCTTRNVRQLYDQGTLKGQRLSERKVQLSKASVESYLAQRRNGQAQPQLSP